MICLGIDPGIGRMGYGAVRQVGSSYQTLFYGCIETPADMDVPSRLLCIYEQVGKYIEECKPDLMAVEKLYFGQNTTTAERVWQARGVALLLGAVYGLKVIEPTPLQAKMTVCGDGRADKLQVQRMVQYILGLGEIPKPDDAADALAVALAGLSLASSPGYNLR